jgi:hypothetical protein
LNARLYDVFPDGTQVLVDRGVQRLTDSSGIATLDLHGNAWRFEAGHRIRLELAQDDDPYVKSSSQPGSLTIEGAQLTMPIREISPEEPGDAGPTLRVSVRQLGEGRMRATARSATGERYGIESYELFVGVYRDYQPTYEELAGEPDEPSRTYDGIPGIRYVFAARATDVRGVRGPLAYRTVTAR